MPNPAGTTGIPPAGYRIEVYAKPGCGWCQRAKGLLRGRGLDFAEIDIEADPAREEEMVRRSGRPTVPQVFINGIHVGGYEDLRAAEASGGLDRLLGASPPRSGEKGMETKASKHRVVIMGSGSAGLTAALYAARARLSPLLFEGAEAGGQLTLTTDVENFPGFPEGILGPDLMAAMRAQAERFGTEIVRGSITRADLSSRPFRLETDNGPVLAETLIVASGASARLLGLESEKKLIGHGVSTCATCDGFFFRDKKLLVVGGGDSAMEEALFLTKFASRVTVVHRREALRASKFMQDRAFKNEKVDFLWNRDVADIRDPEKGRVVGAVLRDTKSGATEEVPCDGIFVAIGHVPNTKIFAGQLETNANGYILTRNGTKTSVPGVFAAGDVQDPVYRQAITAAGSGCMAAIDAERFLESQPEG